MGELLTPRERLFICVVSIRHFPLIVIIFREHLVQMIYTQHWGVDHQVKCRMKDGNQVVITIVPIGNRATPAKISRNRNPPSLQHSRTFGKPVTSTRIPVLVCKCNIVGNCFQCLFFRSVSAFELLPSHPEWPLTHASSSKNGT